MNCEVVVLELEHDVVQAQLKTSQDTLDATRLRLKAGSIAQVDLDRTLMAHIENQRLFQQTELSLTTAEASINKICGVLPITASLLRQAMSEVAQQNDLQDYLQNNLLSVLFNSISCVKKPISII